MKIAQSDCQVGLDAERYEQHERQIRAASGVFIQFFGVFKVYITRQLYLPDRLEVATKCAKTEEIP